MRRKLKRVRLADVPLEERFKAAARLARNAPPLERKELMTAALNPSDRVYLVPEQTTFFSGRRAA